MFEVACYPAVAGIGIAGLAERRGELVHDREAGDVTQVSAHREVVHFHTRGD